jgi:hypothetical protein
MTGVMKEDHNRLEISYRHVRAAAEGKFAVVALVLAALVLVVLIYVGSPALGLF